MPGALGDSPQVTRPTSTPSGAARARPDDGRRLLPPFRGRRHLYLAGDIQRHASEGLASATRGVLRGSRDRGRRHDGRNHGRVQTGHGHQPQGPVGLSRLGAFPGQYRRGIVRAQPLGQPAQPRTRRGLFRPRGGPLSSGGLSADPLAWRHRLLADGASRSLGSGRRAVHLRHRRHAGLVRNRRESAAKCLERVASPSKAQGAQRAGGVRRRSSSRLSNNAGSRTSVWRRSTSPSSSIAPRSAAGAIG